MENIIVRHPTVDFYKLEKVYYETYGEHINRDDFGWEDFGNDCYKVFYMESALDEDATDFQIKLAALLAKCGVGEEETVLINVSW